MPSWEQILRESSSDRRVESMEPVKGSHGPPVSYYHNPETGQEFPGLPLDAWSLMRYISRGLRPGRAPVELRAMWAEAQLKQKRPEFDPEVLAYVEGVEQQQSTGNNKLEALVLALQQQVTSLTEKLTGAPVTEPVDVASQEPVQLKLL